ncbi:thioredoxin domain-containing protein [Salibacterium salarium]|uniref:Thioredoxin domain-containing protein n=1 Tax=Salibacterium salarium TaxID=284579 RepID=A0A428N163_9BACI|nr:thioredoxin domain-containing protein [Salibacterium salarium]RSL32195.1 thioredoxin domain-containing protein [Salibacterium salarium]
MANRLIHEKSPYLLQHAHNPVDWYPWGEEAFEKAKRENKPVMVSIGYSTCHWCHVMERESFEDEEVARLLNERFVAVKVDREERPDIDSIYMIACQAMTGHGGWPLNVFVTPEQKPFYAGTYFPKESMRGMPGMMDVVTQLYDKYKDDPEKIKEVSDQMEDVIQPQTAEGETELSEDVLQKGFDHMRQTFNITYGGFGDAPKFPQPHVLMFLFRYYRYSGNETALQMALKTLDGMAAGGMYDHIGYGFSRYSVDEKWLVPHFEKMLYDNALLAMAYTEAYQVTGYNQYRQTAEEVFTYVLRDMQDENGGFYSGEDADSEGVEGKFYIWGPEEIKEILGEENGSLFCEVYDITEDGNFEGENIPNLIRQFPEQFALSHEFDPVQVQDRLEQAKELLFEHREKRVHPHKDDKILTSWNALMTAALAKAARVFEVPRYVQEAKRAFSFIESELVQDSRLMVRYREGDVKHKGFVEDYANVLWAALELYDSSLDVSYLEKAKHYADQMIELFWDDKNGGFFFYGNDGEQLLARPKESFDGAMPSGNSVAAVQLLRLARFTGDLKYEEKTRKSQDAFARELKQFPHGHMHFIQSYLLLFSDMKEVVVLTNDAEEDAERITKQLQQQFYPELTYLIHSDPDKLAEVAPFTNAHHKIDGKTTVYVCQNFACHQPVVGAKKAFELLEEEE